MYVCLSVCARRARRAHPSVGPVAWLRLGSAQTARLDAILRRRAAILVSRLSAAHAPRMAFLPLFQTSLKHEEREAYNSLVQKPPTAAAAVTAHPAAAAPAHVHAATAHAQAAAAAAEDSAPETSDNPLR